MIFPDFDRIIFLDSDTLIFKDIAEMYYLPFNDNYILEDGTTGDERKISVLDNYLILKNDQNTDQRSTKLFIKLCKI